MSVDPVCGREVDEETPYKLERHGIVYCFDSRACAEEFDENSEEYMPHPSEEVHE